MDKRHTDSHMILRIIYIGAVLFIIAVVLSGCATSCSPNERSMCHMTADEIRSELK